MTPDPSQSEWREGWRIVAACAIANGTGVSLVFYCFSMFLLPMSADLQLSRDQTAFVQAMVVSAALGAPLIGRLTDLLGFRTVFTTCTLALGLVGVLQGTVVDTVTELAASVAVTAFLGAGTSSITLTRPINAHFRRYRGRALGLVGVGVSITTILVPPGLEMIISQLGWRAGFLALAAFGVGIGMPLVLALMPREAALARQRRRIGGLGADWSFLRLRDFWLLALAGAVINVATAGTVSQLSPMIQSENISARTAALGLSLFAGGQFVGKLAGGWLLDWFEPRRTAVGMIVIPACGFLIFLDGIAPVWAALLACVMIGLLQGADVDIFSFFTARRFGYESYGTVFGLVHGLGWIGSVGGILAFGSSYSLFGSYAPAQWLSLGALGIGAVLLLAFRLSDEEAGAKPV